MPARDARLRAEGAEPHEIAGANADPLVVQEVICFSLQHVEAMFHDVGFGERDASARLEGHDIDVHVVADVIGISKARGRPFVSVGHGGRGAL